MNDLVELLGTSEVFAMAMSTFFISTGPGVWVALGVAVGEAVGAGVFFATGITFPESQARIVLPFDLTFTQVNNRPFRVVVCPAKRHLICGFVAAIAGKAIENHVEMIPKAKTRRGIDDMLPSVEIEDELHVNK